jgi:hypothetical protein
MPCSQTFSIRGNAWDNWYGYIGSKRVESFFATLGETQEQAAHAWLDAQERTYGAAPVAEVQS